MRKTEDGFEIISDDNRRWREQAMVTAREEDEKSRRKRRAEAKREERARKRARYTSNQSGELKLTIYIADEDDVQQV